MNSKPIVVILLLAVGLIILAGGCALGIFLAPHLAVLEPMVGPDDVALQDDTSSQTDIDMSELPTAVAPAFPTPIPQDTLQDADAEEALVASIYEHVAPSVVHIRVVQNVSESDEPPIEIPGWPDFDIPEDFYSRGEGSGFVWDSEGHIVTNYHVIENAENVEVIFIDGASFEAEVVGTDRDSDLAVLRVESPTDWLIPVSLGDSDAAFVGQRAIAIGNPFGQEWTLTMGIVSALGRTMPSGTSRFSIPEMIQTDTAINPGNSGGPLLDRNGHVIGINTLILTESTVSSGVGFAIPINVAKQVVPSLVNQGYHAYAWLGITGSDVERETAVAMDLPPEQRGALVIAVTEGSPADRAGLLGANETVTLFGSDLAIGGDIIIAAEGDPIRNMDDLIVYLVKETRPDQEITLTLLRDGEEMELEVTLGERPR
jgi:2-alkenal reductase